MVRGELMYTKLSIATRRVPYICDTNRAEGVHSRIYHAYERVYPCAAVCWKMSAITLVLSSSFPAAPLLAVGTRRILLSCVLRVISVFLWGLYADKFQFGLYFRQVRYAAFHYTRHDPHTWHVRSCGRVTEQYTTRNSSTQYYGRA